MKCNNIVDGYCVVFHVGIGDDGVSTVDLGL